MRTFFLGIVTLALFGCASEPKKLPRPTLSNCQSSRWTDINHSAITALDHLVGLIEAKCFREALHLGEHLRNKHRDKDYSIVQETLSVLAPEDQLGEYILESYERAYLAFLLSSVHLALGSKDAAAVELRRSYDEGKALIYNYGEDPVNALLIAVLWENLGDGDLARPFWQKIIENSRPESPAAVFAASRIAIHDQGGAHNERWRIISVGEFPELDWSFRFTKNSSGYYDIKTRSDFPFACSSSTGLRLDTAPWLEKIRLRYASDYHPLLNAKSWIRAPIGLAYGITTFAVGAGVSVAGCSFAFGDKHAIPEICIEALKAGVSVMAKSPDVVDYMLRPDLRHWRRVPAAVLVTRVNDLADESCWMDLGSKWRGSSYEFAGGIKKNGAGF